MIEKHEIKEPVRSDIHWVKYWLRMKTKLNCNNFDENARQLRNKVIGVSMMKGHKTDEDIEVVKICDAILQNQAQKEKKMNRKEHLEELIESARLTIESFNEEILEKQIMNNSAYGRMDKYIEELKDLNHNKDERFDAIGETEKKE